MRINFMNRGAVLIFLSGLLFVGAGCISIGGGTNAGADGGVFKTFDKGDNWAQKNAVLTVGDRRNINSVNVSTIVQDPSDASAIYIGTADNGLLYSYDGGESWQQPAPPVNRGRVPSLAIDPKNKCTLYVAFENRLVKSDDCSRSWTAKYVDTRLDKQTTAVAVDAFNPRIVWIANNAGDLLKSADGGESWASVRNFGGSVSRLAMSPSDSRRFYVATKSSGVWRTDDAGQTWKDLSDGYKQFDGGREFSDIAVGVADSSVVVLATKYGLIRSRNNGDAWESIPLLTPPGTALIYSVAMDPRDANNLYYGTSTTFYRTSNGGVNWVTKKLPTSRTATAMIVDRANPSILYMGVTRFKQ